MIVVIIEGKEDISMSNVLKVSTYKCECGETAEILVPGYKKEEVSLELKSDADSFKDGSLLLWVVAENASRGKSANWIVIDTNIFDTKNIEAGFEDCILKVKLPYKAEFKNRIIPII